MVLRKLDIETLRILSQYVPPLGANLGLLKLDAELDGSILVPEPSCGTVMLWIIGLFYRFTSNFELVTPGPSLILASADHFTRMHTAPQGRGWTQSYFCSYGALSTLP